MTVEIITNRLEDLYNVLFFCSDRQAEMKGAMFRTNDRICINQERGSLFTQLAYLQGEITNDEMRDYKCPPEIEIKIRFALQKIIDTNWGGFTQSRFLKEPSELENEY